jgi:hypothetical protein
MTLVSPFGPEPTRRDAPDSATLAEETVFSMLEAAKRLGVDPADTAAMITLDLVAKLAAYGRSPVSVTLAVLAVAAPAREAVLRDCNARGVEAPSLSTAKLQALAPGSCRLH